jgi:hypothetical protein
LFDAIGAKFAQWHATKTGDAEPRDRLTAEMIALLSDENAADIAQSLSSEELNTPFGLAALARWLEVDSIGAADWVATRADSTEAEALVVARKLLADPPGLAAFCDALPDVKWKQQFLGGAALEALPTDPRRAIDLGQRMSSGADQANVLQTIAYDWMTRDPVAASDWIVKTSDATVREQLLVAASKAIAATDPDLAAGWTIAAIKSQELRTDTALVVVEVWAAQDPARAANWVSRFPAGESRDTAVDTIVHRWINTDAAATEAWIQNLPDREAIRERLRKEQAARNHAPDAK